MLCVAYVADVLPSEMITVERERTTTFEMPTGERSMTDAVNSTAQPQKCSNRYFFCRLLIKFASEHLSV